MQFTTYGGGEETQHISVCVYATEKAAAYVDIYIGTEK